MDFYPLYLLILWFLIQWSLITESLQVRVLHELSLTLKKQLKKEVINMRDTLRDSMDELMQFANNKPNKVTVKKYTLNNNPSDIKKVRDKTQKT